MLTFSNTCSLAVLLPLLLWSTKGISYRRLSFARRHMNLFLEFSLIDYIVHFICWLFRFTHAGFHMINTRLPINYWQRARHTSSLLIFICWQMPPPVIPRSWLLGRWNAAKHYFSAYEISRFRYWFRDGKWDDILLDREEIPFYCNYIYFTLAKITKNNSLYYLRALFIRHYSRWRMCAYGLMIMIASLSDTINLLTHFHSCFVS